MCACSVGEATPRALRRSGVGGDRPATQEGTEARVVRDEVGRGAQEQGAHWMPVNLPHVSSVGRSREYVSGWIEVHAALEWERGTGFSSDYAGSLPLHYA